MVVCAISALAWLSPRVIVRQHPYGRHRADRQAGSVVYADNDIAGIFATAPETSLRQAGRWFISGDWIDVKGGGPFWRPLVSCWWWLEYRLFTTDFVLYNLATVVLVAITCCLLAGAVAALSRSLLLGAAAAGLLVWKFSGKLYGILFWFPAQTDVLAGLFLAGAFYLLVVGMSAEGRRRHALLGGSLACYVGAVLTKESALAFPLVAWAAFWLRLRRGGIPWMIAYGATGLFLLTARTLILGGTGHFLVRLQPVHLLLRAAFQLLGVRLLHGPQWPPVGAAILALAVLITAFRPSLARRRCVAYAMAVATPALLVLAAHFTMGSAVGLLELAAWKSLAAPLLLILGGAMVFRWRPVEGLVLACFLVAATAQLILVRDWVRPHYYFLPAMAWASLDAVALGAAWQHLKWLRRAEAAEPPAAGSVLHD